MKSIKDFKDSSINFKEMRTIFGSSGSKWSCTQDTNDCKYGDTETRTQNDQGKLLSVSCSPNKPPKGYEA